MDHKQRNRIPAEDAKYQKQREESKARHPCTLHNQAVQCKILKSVGTASFKPVRNLSKMFGRKKL